MIIFENWPYRLLEEKRNWNKHVKDRERLIILKAEYYGRGKTFEERARSIGMTDRQYYHLRKKHGLMEDKDGYLTNPKED